MVATAMTRLRPTEAAPRTVLPNESASVHLDALRGFAAFSVLLNHLRDALFVDYRSVPHHNPATAMAYLVAGLGRQWVVVFFVMSGYLVGGGVLRSVTADRWSWRSYLLARLTRLYIVLLPALLLGGAIDWAGVHVSGAEALYSGHSGMKALTENVHSTLTLPVLAANSLFLQTIALPGLHGRAVPTFGSNGPLWSLSNEFWYYMAFPPMALLLAKGRRWWIRLICGLALLAWGWFVGPDIAVLGIPWLMGVLIALLPPFPARRSRTRILAIFSALMLLGAGLVLDKILNSIAGDLVEGLVVTLLIWVTLHCETAPLPTSYVRLARRSARSSYTLYLVHMPLLIFLKASLHLPRALPNWHLFIVSAGLLAGILLYSQLVYEAFEKNTDRVRSWIKPYVMGRRLA
jgi:peptidoglycan/LPS O-acetylase OafA/YrhL